MTQRFRPETKSEYSERVEKLAEWCLEEMEHDDEALDQATRTVESADMIHYSDPVTHVRIIKEFSDSEPIRENLQDVSGSDTIFDNLRRAASDCLRRDLVEEIKSKSKE